MGDKGKTELVEEGVELQRIPNGFNPSPRGQTGFEAAIGHKNTDLVHLSWHELTYQVKIPDPTAKKRMFPPQFRKPQITKTILNNISASVKPGQFLAIMGPSGAGKTSLLNCLAGRVNSGSLSGDVLVNGNEVNRRKLKRNSGYVMQEDILFANLTVREQLSYSALLRLPPSMPRKEKLARVQTVITELNLSKVADSKIGGQVVRGISGGERKRVNIGTELITDPSILFLDEPTTGLDSFTALGIVETLKALARANRSVVCTIHQPRSNIFEMFDMLLLLARGNIVYFGPASTALEYFSSIGYPAPAFSNPADYFLDMSADDTRNEEVSKESNQRVNQLVQAYASSKTQEEAAVRPPKEPNTWSKQKGFTDWFTQSIVLLQRAAKNTFRNHIVNGTRLVQNIVLGVLVGLIYLQMSHDQTSIGDRQGLGFFIIVNQAFNALFTSINVFPIEKKVVDKERLAGMYRVSAYYTAKILVDLPLAIFFPIVFGVIIYWMTGLQQDAGKFFIFLAALELTTFCAEALGLFVTVAIPNPGVATALCPTVLVLFLLFSGFYLNNASAPKYFIWIRYISFIQYGFAAIMINEFDGLNLRCKPSQLIDGVCPVTNGSQVIDRLDPNTKSILANLMILLGMVLFYRVLIYIFLRIWKPKPK